MVGWRAGYLRLRFRLIGVGPFAVPGLLAAVLGRLARFLAGHRRQLATRQIEVRERQQREHLCAVLRDASVSNFAIAELALHDAEDVLHLGPDRSVLPVAFALRA